MPSLPGSLVSGPAAAFLENIQARMPTGSATYYLECRLSGNPQVDVEAGYTRPEAIPMLQGLIPAAVAPFVLLEWDQAQDGRDTRPGLLLCLDRRLGIGACGNALPPLQLTSLVAAAEAVSRQWLGRTLENSVSEALAACFTNLPRGGRILHLSAMSSRNPPLLKLNIVMPPRAFPGYLRRIGWKGASQGLSRLWKTLRPFVREAKFDLILQGGIHPKLGLELFPSNSSLGSRVAALGRLTTRKWIRPEKGRDLSRWPGTVWRVDARRNRILRIDKDFGLKFVLDGAGEVESKGYLQIFPQCASVANASIGAGKTK